MPLIRRMRESDVHGVSRMQCHSFAWGAEREGFTARQIDDYCHLRGSETSIREQLQQDTCIVACLNDNIVGVIGINGRLVTKLYVSPEHLDRGIGSRLFRAAEEEIADQGHGELEVVTVFPSTVPFYERMGLQVADQVPLQRGPMSGRDSIRLRKSLA